MRIDGIYIDGFGIFHDHNVTDFGTGLTVIYGPNEAGKTTLLNFIKRTLFGYPDGRSSVNPYPPLEGGQHGGRLSIETEAGQATTVERYKGKSLDVLHPDGSAGSEAELNSCMGNASKEIFESIYAFGLEELQDIDILSSDSVRDMLFGAGAGIKGASLSDLRKEVERTKGSLFKPGAQKPKMNALMKRLKDTKVSLRALEDGLADYDMFNSELVSVVNDIGTMNEELRGLNSKTEHLRALQTAWDDWCIIVESTERLGALPSIDEFPQNGVEVLVRLRDVIEEQTSDIEERDAEIKKVSEEIDRIEVDTNIIDARERISVLYKGEEKYRSSRDDIGALQANLRNETTALETTLREIGPGWDIDRLGLFDTSIPFRERVRDRKETKVQLRESMSTQQAQVSSIERDMERIEKELVELRERAGELEANAITAEEMESRRRDLQELRTKHRELGNSTVKRDAVLRQEDLINMMRPERTVEKVKAPTWPAPTLGTLGALSIALGYYTGQVISGSAIGAALLVSAALYWRQTRGANEHGTQGPDGADQPSERKVNDVGAQREELEKRIGMVEGEVRTLEKRLALDGTVSEATIDQALQDLQAAELVVAERRSVIKAIERKDGERTTLGTKLENEGEALVLISKEMEEHESEWKSWLEDKDLPTEMSEDTVLDLVKTIEIAKEKQGTARVTAGRIELIEEFIGTYEEDIDILVDDLGRSEEKGDALVGVIKLESELGMALESKGEVERLQGKVEDLQGDLERLHGRRDSKALELSQLLEGAGAKDEEEFLRMAEDWDTITQLRTAMRDSEAAIKRISGPDGYESFTEEMEASSPEDLNTRIADMTDRIDLMGKEIAELQERKGELKKEIEQIERSEEASQLRLVASSLKGGLDQNAKEWAVATLADALISRAVERYERERQPGIIKEAQSFFGRMTLECYLSVMAPLGEECIYVEDGNALRKDVSQLSRGTAEQLYLALRFGYVNELGRRTERLPLIFDDILVNFDDERLRATCEAIGELASANQVIYFTCHEATVDVLTETVEGCKVVRLGIA